jgi:hypothetical protein
MAPLVPRRPLDGPQLMPPRFSLLDAADQPADDRPGFGADVQPDACSGDDTFTFDPCEAHEIPDAERVGTEQFDPFGIGVVFECNTMSGYTAGDFRAKARHKLEVFQAKLIEEQVWRATTIATNPDLTDAEQYVPAAAAGLDPGPALGCLEHRLKQCGSGGPGIIHATAQLVDEWISLGLVRQSVRWKGDQLYTHLDNIVVPGSGYDGSAPSGTPQVGVQWAYATGMVQIRLAPVIDIPRTGDDRAYMRDATDRSVNTVRVVAERSVLVVWDPCCVIGVRVDVQGCSTGS